MGKSRIPRTEILNTRLTIEQMASLDIECKRFGLSRCAVASIAITTYIEGRSQVMNHDVMLWNKDHTESVRASKIRNFAIYPERDYPGNIERRKLLGWYNANESFYFGYWDTEEEARHYLIALHEQIEGG